MTMFGNKLAKVEKLVAKGKADALIPLTADKGEEVRLAAVRALGRCDDDNAFNALVPLLNHSDESVRSHASNALGKMGLPKARTFLLHRKDAEKDAGVLKAIAEALHQIEVRV